jgi:hypothetical protein
MKRRLNLALALVGLLAVAGVGQAAAEQEQRGNVIVSLSGGISPRMLPRAEKAPVAVHLSGGVRTSDAAPLPRVNRLKLELGWRGHLNVQGLPVCPAIRLRGRASSQALASCAPSLVGQGGLKAKIYVPGQEPFDIKANLLAFNGRTKVGRRAVLIHAYTSDPPISFVIPFIVRRSDGAFKTVLVTTIRRAVGTWPHVSRFRIDIGRNFSHEGRSESYLNASCPIPEGFTAGFLSFARATYTFAGGDALTTESVRGCRARKGP